MANFARMRETILYMTLGLNKVRFMARPAIRRRSCILPADVALGTVGLHMPPG